MNDKTRAERLESERLELFVPTAAILERSAGDRVWLAAQLGRAVAEDWPPQEWDEPAARWLANTMTQRPEEPFFRTWFIAMRQGPVIGTCGSKGPPDSEGAVEIGYGVVCSVWRKGLGSEAAGLLISWIFRDPRVRIIRAHTRSGDPASSGVLRRNGFALVQTIEDPREGLVDRFERGR